MLQSLLARLKGANDDEKGFTLIELLVVVLIIGILAAIALPTFLGQQTKAQDASAKSNVRNAVTQVESCLADATSTTAAACGTTAGNSGLAALGNSVTTSGVALSATGQPAYTIVARSQSNNTYTITKDGTTGKSTYTSSNSDARWAANTTT